MARGRTLGVLAVLALAATALFAWSRASGAERELGLLAAERTRRVELVSAFARALLSYDYRDLPAARAALSRLATGELMARYDREFGGATAREIQRRRAVSTATVREVYLPAVAGASTRAVVAVDTRVESSRPLREVRGAHLKLLLAKEGAAWRVQEVDILAEAGR